MTAKLLASLLLVVGTCEVLLAQRAAGERPPRPRWVRLSVAYGPFGPTIQAVVIPPPRDPGSYLQGPQPRFGGELPGLDDFDRVRPKPPAPPPERTQPPRPPAAGADPASRHDLTANATIRPASHSVDMAVDVRDLNDFTRAFISGNQRTMQELYASKRVVEVKAPLRVVLLNTLQDLAYVRVAEGPFAGKVYVLKSKSVKPD